MGKKILSAGLLALLLSCILLLISCDRHKDSGLWLYANQFLLFSSEEGPALQQASLSGEVKLNFYNNTDTDASITLYTNAAENGLVTLSAPAGDSACATVSLSGKGDINNGVRIMQGETDSAYILSARGLQTAASDAPDITLLRDITLEEPFYITTPLSLSTDGHTLSIEDLISFITNEFGALSLSGDITATNFYARAPKCDITLPDSLAWVCDRGDVYNSFHIAAASLNGNTLDGSVTASTIQQLYNLAEGERWERAIPGMTIRLGNFNVDQLVTFTEPVSIQNDAAEIILASSPAIEIKTDASGEIRIEGLARENILLRAPNCSLIWEENGPPLHTAAQYYKLQSYNGQSLSEYILGGACSAVPDIMLEAANNLYVLSDMHWTAADDTPFVLRTQIDHVIPPSALKNAVLTVSVPEGCTVSFAGSINSDGTVNLLDAMGCYVRVSDASGSSLYYIETAYTLQMPVVLIETDSGAAITSKEEYVDAAVSIESDYTDGLPSLEPSAAKIRGRGNTTWEWAEKKPYKIRFEEPVSVLGMESGKTWVLLANFADKSLIRNYVALECAKVLDNMDCYATQYPVDVYINGEYAGIYTLGQQVEKGQDRLYIQEDAGNVNTGFLLELGVSHESGHPVFSSSILRNVGVLEPANADEQTLTYIQNYINVTDNAVKLMDHYENYIDVPSLIDWFIMTELSYNADSCFRRSVFMTKGAGQKLKMSQVWDFDLAFGNSVADQQRYEEWACLTDDGGYVHYNWMCQLMRNDTFVAQLRERWNQVKDELLETAMASLEEGYRLTAPSADDNFALWDILFARVGMQPEAVVLCYTHERQVEYLRTFIETRWNWMDQELNATAGE